MAGRRGPTADLWLGLALAGASLALIVHMLRVPGGSAVSGVSPLSLPLAMAALILALSLLMLLQALARRGVAGALPPEAEGTWRIGALVALSVGFVVALPWLGYVLASAAFTGAAAWLYGARRPLIVLALMLFAPIAISIFFERAMVIYLPSGRLLP